MSKRVIVLLAIVVAGLSAYIALFERGSVTSKELAERSGRVLVSFVRDKVERVEIQRKGKRVVLARKAPAGADDGSPYGWELREPLSARADSDAIDPLLGELEWLSARRTLEAVSQEDEQRFGLRAPRYRVSYTVGGKTHVLTLGNDDVHGEGVYARVDDEARAYVVPKTVLEPLNHEPGHFRDKQPFPDLVKAWARKIAVRYDDVSFEAVREHDRWWLVDDPKVYADDKRISEMVEAVAELRVARYVEPEDAALAEAALKTPRLRVEVSVIPDETREDRTSQRYALELGSTTCGKHEGEVYGRIVGGALICLREPDLKLLQLPPDELRDRTLFSVERASLAGFELTRGGTTLSVTREGDTWKEKGGAALDAHAVDAWLVTLAAARATGFQPLAGFREQGALTLQLGGDKRVRIALGELDARGEFIVRRGDESVLVRFPGGLADVLTPTRARFASLEVWRAYQPSQIVRAEARAEGHQRSWALESGSWKLKSGDLGGDVARLRELLRALIDLEARVYVSDEPRAAHGLTPGSGTLTLGLSTGKTLTLTLGAATPKGAYAQVDGGAVIEVDAEVVGWLKELAGGPRAPVEPSEADEDDEDEHDRDHAGHDHAH